MTAKETLRSMATINLRISQRVRLIEFYRDQAARMGHALNGVCVQSSRTSSTMEFWADKALDLARDIDKEVEALRFERRLVSGIIDQIQDEKQKLVLELRYFSPEPMTWEQISVVMGYAVRQVLRLHGEALLAYERKLRGVESESIGCL